MRNFVEFHRVKNNFLKFAKKYVEEEISSTLEVHRKEVHWLRNTYGSLLVIDFHEILYGR